MNRSLSALILILTAALIAGYLFVADERGTDERGAGERRGPEQARTEDTSSSAADPNLADADGLPGTNALDAPASRVDVAVAAQRFGTWEPRWLEGEIRLPAGVPLDETLRILVLSRQLKHEELHGQRGLLNELASPDGRRPEELLAVVETTKGGAFRAPYPSAAQWIWLVVDGRYLYVPEPVGIALPSGTVDLEPLAGAWIHGSVTAPPGFETTATLGDCRASLAPESDSGTRQVAERAWQLVRRAKVREEAGHWSFEFRAVPAGSTLVAEVQCPTLIDYTEEGIEPRAGEEIQVEARLVLGASLSGSVLSPMATPVGNARVRLVQRFVFGVASDTVAETRSADDGTFLLEGIPAGEASLLAEKEGYLPSSPLSLELEESEKRSGQTLELQSGDSLSGIALYSTGEPARRALVQVGFDPAALAGLGALASMYGGSGSTVADDDGRFTVHGLGVGPFEVTATTETNEGEFEGLWFGRLAGIQPPAEDLELILQPSQGLRGRVVDLDGAPITAFSISLEVEGRENPLARMRETTWGKMDAPDSELADEEARQALDRRSLDVVDESGEFEFGELHRGAWQLTARAEGFATPDPLRLELPQASNTVQVITMARESRVSGRVLDPDGSPVAQAMVTLQLSRQQLMARLTGTLSVPEALSDAEGNFMLDELPAGTVALIASHAEHASSAALTLELTPGQILEEVNLTLGEGGVLSGVVFGKDGQLAHGLEVVIQNQGSFATNTIRTEEDGTFRVEHLDPGAYQVTAILSEDAWGRDLEDAADTAGILENIRFTLANVVEGEETTVSLGAPPADPVLVRGKVTQAGRPVPSVLVSFTPEKGKGFESMKFAQTKTDGSYETELVAPGRHLISVQILAAGGMEQQQLEYNREIPDEEEYRLDFELPGARISGSIEDAEGQALARARVSLGIEGGIATGTMLGGHYAEVTTDEDGHYSFDYLRAGFYSVAAGGAPFGGAFGTRAVNGRSIQDRIRVTENEHRSGIDFRLRQGGNIKGTIRDAAGAPVGGASVFVRDERGRLLERFSLISTGPDGVYEYSGLAPGSYRVTARAGGVTSNRQDWVRVREASTATADLSVDAGTVLEIQLIDTAGEELKATLSVTDEEGNEMTGMLAYNELINQAANGFRSDVQRVGPLPAGKYTLRAETADGRSAEKTVTVRNKPERRIKLRIK